MPEQLINEYVETEVLEDRAEKLRINEAGSRFLGATSLAAAAFGAFASLKVKNTPVEYMGLDCFLVLSSYISASLSSSYGRRADVIDAELLRRQIPPEDSDVLESAEPTEQ